MRTAIEHQMYLRETGPAGEAPLLWIHGLGESGLCFEAIIAHPRLQGRRHLVPDLPGYGRSTPKTPSQSFAAVADHLAAWLAARGEEPAVVIGHSLGGVLALVLAERHPSRVARVVDVDGNKSPGDCVYSGRALAWSAEEFARSGFDALCAEVAATAPGDPAVQGYLRSLAMTDAATFRCHAAELVALSETDGLARRLAALAVPAHYIAGVPGGAAPASIQRLAAAGVEPLQVAPSGHWPYIDQPDMFTEFLGRILGV